MNPNNPASILNKAVKGLIPDAKKALLFSFFTNILVMMPTVYMLEVYDRVVNSRNFMTLAMLTALVIGLYILMEILEWVRSEIMHSASIKFDNWLSERIFNTVFEANLKKIPGASIQVFNDFKTLRDFIASPTVIAVMDVPLAMLYTLIVFAINPYLGWLSVVGAVVQVILAYFTERSTVTPLMDANRAAISAQNYANGTLRNAQVIEAMGMGRSIHNRWLKRQQEFLGLQANASDNAGYYASLSKLVQNVQSSILLGGGCWLSLKGLMPNGGLIVVASTLGARMLTPISQIIAQWKQVVQARDAFMRLDKLTQAIQLREAGMPLPPPKGNLSVEAVVAAAPGSQVPIIRGVNFAVPAGKAVAIVGPSASGKSTLARLLVGIWPAASGKVRLDGADIYPWHKTELGPYLGYLPQGVELFDGSIAENIARFGEIDMEKIEAAAKAVGIHDLIMSFPEGYSTRIGEDGCFLSGGQRQRVGLARAIYGNPRFLVLDEPNSSLDEMGERYLVQTILNLKAQGSTVIVITHRTNILAAVDLMLILRDGAVQAYGPRDEVLAALQGKNQQTANPPSNQIAPAKA